MQYRHNMLVLTVTNTGNIVFILGTFLILYLLLIKNNFHYPSSGASPAVAPRLLDELTLLWRSVTVYDTELLRPNDHATLDDATVLPP